MTTPMGLPVPVVEMVTRDLEQAAVREMLFEAQARNAALEAALRDVVEHSEPGAAALARLRARHVLDAVAPERRFIATLRPSRCETCGGVGGCWDDCTTYRELEKP